MKFIAALVYSPKLLFRTRFTACPARDTQIVMRFKALNPLICQRDNRLYPPRPAPYNGLFLGYGAAENGSPYGFGSLLLKDTLHEKVVTSARSRDDGAEFLLCKRL
ncbi:TPA: hypothetical protein RGH07_002128 [Serratia marcescens]|nr:hypothetical protein [Serratia marcescens]